MLFRFFDRTDPVSVIEKTVEWDFERHRMSNIYSEVRCYLNLAMRWEGLYKRHQDRSVAKRRKIRVSELLHFDESGVVGMCIVYAALALDAF